MDWVFTRRNTGCVSGQGMVSRNTSVSHFLLVVSPARGLTLIENKASRELPFPNTASCSVCQTGGGVGAAEETGV